MPINNLRKRTKDQAENEDVDDEAGARDSASYDNGKTKGAAQMSLAATTDEAQAADGRRWGVGSLIASAKERAVAYREDSMRRLKYCLEWVTYATALLNQHIYDLRKFLESLQEAARIVLAGGTNTATLEVAASDQQTENGEEGRQMSANALYATQNVREAALRLAQRKREIVVTVKKAVGIISQYAGSVLPGEARRQVRGLILSLPGRWMTVDTAVSVASSVTSDDSVPRNGAEESSSSSASGNIEANARRTLAFATESFYMLDNVRNVFQNLYVNAERWVGAPSTTNGSAAPEGEEGVPLVAVSAAAPEDPFNTYRDGAKSSSRGGTGKVPVRKPPKKLPAGLVMTAAVEEPSVNSQRLSTQSLVEIGEQMRRMDMSQKRSSMQQQGTSSMMDVDDATTVPHQYLLSSPQFSAVRTTYDEAVANKRNRTREPSPSRGANM
ncbi:transcriptional regulator opi1 [Linderina macrospora]|uniref:Transcriptional regulator opi1 n=1 Tax=Linderina macrospora TaxID=4868 RepID=A0ACC1JDR4_9FUNG|nr:transcriptional regulator opi1 [Linderina macrospora]